MSPLIVGLIAGIVFGALAVASMLPLSFPDKRAALLGAFINRLTIGVVIGAAWGSPQIAALRVSGWTFGAGIGFLLSAADAVITKAYVPLLVIGTVGGALIGWIVTR